jgi:hypothetical protein
MDRPRANAANITEALPRNLQDICSKVLFVSVESTRQFLSDFEDTSSSSPRDTSRAQLCTGQSFTPVCCQHRSGLPDTLTGPPFVPVHPLFWPHFSKLAVSGRRVYMSRFPANLCTSPLAVPVLLSNQTYVPVHSPHQSNQPDPAYT